MPLDIPDGSEVFVDANIFVYHFSGPTDLTESCSEFLQRIAEAKLSAHTSTLALAETLHRLMIIEASSKLHLEPKGAVRHLKTHPSDAKTLTGHLVTIEAVLAMGVKALPIEIEDVVRGNDLKKEFGLLTNDSINLAVMGRHRLKHLATNDLDFERVPGLTVWRPARVPP